MFDACAVVSRLNSKDIRITLVCLTYRKLYDDRGRLAEKTTCCVLSDALLADDGFNVEGGKSFAT